MHELGMEILFVTKTVNWEGIKIQMRDFNELRKWKISKKEMKEIIQESSEPFVTQEATDQIIKILDAKYEKANLRVVANGANHLTPMERGKLFKLLIKYQEIFDGTLGV